MTIQSAELQRIGGDLSWEGQKADLVICVSQPSACVWFRLWDNMRHPNAAATMMDGHRTRLMARLVTRVCGEVRSEHTRQHLIPFTRPGRCMVWSLPLN